MENSEQDGGLVFSIAPVTARAYAAAAEIVKTQVAWSDLLKSHRARGLVPSHLVGYSSSICGATLLDSVVPFLDRGDENAEVVGAAMVPLEVLLGDSWKWTTDCLDAEEQERLEGWLSHPDRADLNCENPAIYCAVPSLGVYWAHEGKNRVQFLRDRGLTHVPGNLTLYAYPAPHRIELFTTRLLGREEVWAVLDRRWVQPIILPALGVSVLNEYGVAAAVRWPENWPDAEVVAESMYRDASPGSARPFNCIDLLPLEARRRDERRGYENVEASIHQLDGFRLKPAPIVAFALACILTWVVGALLKSSMGNAVSFLGLGGLATLGGVLTLPLVRTERRNLEFLYQGQENREGLSLENPIKR